MGDYQGVAGDFLVMLTSQISRRQKQSDEERGAPLLAVG